MQGEAEEKTGVGSPAAGRRNDAYFRTEKQIPRSARNDTVFEAGEMLRSPRRPQHDTVLQQNGAEQSG